MNLAERVSQVRAVTGILHGSRVFCGPLQATLHITNRCNIRCVHCPFFSPYIKRPILLELRRARLAGNTLPDDQYERDLQKHLRASDADSERTCALIDELLRMGTCQFTFAGDGEPFLHKNIMEFMGRVKHGRRTCVVYTNGILLDRNRIDELIKMEVDELRVSLMAGNREMYQRTHKGIGTGTFDTIRDNLLYLSERKGAARSGRPIVTLVNVVFSENAEGLFDFIEFADAVRADRISFQLFNHYSDPGLSILVPTEDQVALVRKHLTALKAYVESKRMDHNIDFFLKVFREKVNTMGLYRSIPCYIGWLWVLFKADGEVHPCCGCNNPLGNVFETGFSEIWKGQAYQKFRREAMQINARGRQVDGCSCQSCSHHTLNMRVYKFLHPLKGHSSEFRQFLRDDAELPLFSRTHPKVK